MRVISLFSGVGGLDLGMIRAGHKIIWANDNDKHAVDTYKKNIGNHIVLGDIQNIDSSVIPDGDIVIGGFPCQGFSIANMNRHEKDNRNFLYQELLRIILEKKPKYFIAENVKGIMSLNQGKVLSMIMQDLHNAGYRANYKILNAADFGVPQKRERVIFFGVRKDLDADIQYPEPTHINPELLTSVNFLDKKYKPWVSVGEALRDIPEPEDSPNIPNHVYSKYKIEFKNYLGHRRLNPDLPSPTVTGRGDNKGGVVVLPHPKGHRRMSVRETAIIQSFPMDFVFFASKSISYRLIANAVPPLLAEAIGKCFS